MVRKPTHMCGNPSIVGKKELPSPDPPYLPRKRPSDASAGAFLAEADLNRLAVAGVLDLEELPGSEAA